MNRRKFSYQLLLLTAILTGGALAMQLFPELSTFVGFYIGSIGFFVLLSLLMFFTAAKAAISKDKNAFTRLIMVFTMAKLFLTVILVIAYKMIAEPKGALFILPFFVIYIAYTVFETSFMTQLGKVKAR